MAVTGSKRAPSRLKHTRTRSLRVRVVRPMENDQPIASRDARRLLQAVIEHRPFACSTREAETEAWSDVNKSMGSEVGGEARFWYLLDVYKRHRMHGMALAGLSKNAIKMLEQIVLCVDTYGYTQRNPSLPPEELDSSPCVSDDNDAKSEDSEPRLLLLQPSQESNAEGAVDRAFSGLSEMKVLLTEAQRACEEKTMQVAVLSDANEELQRENEQLRSEIASLQTELNEAQRTASDDSHENRASVDTAALRTQCLRALMQSLHTMLDTATADSGRAT